MGYGDPTLTIDFETATDEDWETVYETQRRVEAGGKLDPGTIEMGRRVTLTAQPVAMWHAVMGHIEAED